MMPNWDCPALSILIIDPDRPHVTLPVGNPLKRDGERIYRIRCDLWVTRQLLARFRVSGQWL